MKSHLYMRSNDLVMGEAQYEPRIEAFAGHVNVALGLSNSDWNNSSYCCDAALICLFSGKAQRSSTSSGFLLPTSMRALTQLKVTR